jgi:hypothetical protein
MTTAELITSHVWRAPLAGGLDRVHHVPRLERPCEYMNCRRPIGEHARATHGRGPK